MAARKSDAAACDAKSPGPAVASPLARVMREFDELVCTLERRLLRSLDAVGRDLDALDSDCRADIRREACRLAISDLSTQYTRKHIRRSLHAAECDGKRLEEQLHALTRRGVLLDTEDLAGLHNGYFRLFSTELFDLLGQPTDLRFGSLRFHQTTSRSAATPPFLPDAPSPSWVNVELALNSSFFVADSLETLPYHTFRLPTAPSLQNRGILSRKPEDNGAFPTYDSWLLFTFLGNGCIKLEVPVEMCADIYGGPLRGRENDEVLFWGFFVDDDIGS